MHPGCVCGNVSALRVKDIECTRCERVFVGPGQTLATAARDLLLWASTARGMVYRARQDRSRDGAVLAIAGCVVSRGPREEKRRKK